MLNKLKQGLKKTAMGLIAMILLGVSVTVNATNFYMQKILGNIAILFVAYVIGCIINWGINNIKK